MNDFYKMIVIPIFIIAVVLVAVSVLLYKLIKKKSHKGCFFSVVFFIVSAVFISLSCIV